MLDRQSPALAAFVARHCCHAHTERERACSLYYAVRDQINYEIFNIAIDEESLAPAHIIESSRGFCLHKAILFASACRATGISSRLLASRVRNHVSAPAIRKLVGGDIFMHWYTEILIEGNWLKVSPTFNRNLCRLYGLQALDFDGHNDAVDHDNGDGTTMEYLATPSRFDAPTHSELIELIAAYHPHMVNSSLKVPPEKAFSENPQAGSYAPNMAVKG